MTHLSPQISHLVAARPMSITMGNAIRQLKFDISKSSIDLPEQDVRISPLHFYIRCLYSTHANNLSPSAFFTSRPRTHYARISTATSASVSPLLTVLSRRAAARKSRTGISSSPTHGMFSIICRSFSAEGVHLAPQSLRRFFWRHTLKGGDSQSSSQIRDRYWRVKCLHRVCFDVSDVWNLGKCLLSVLSRAGIQCTYLLLASLGSIITEVSTVIVGAHSIHGNGAVYSRAGTALVAMMAKQHSIPFIVCCETYKFSAGVQLDSFTKNELGKYSYACCSPRVKVTLLS